jgi:cation diffusion facilitator CzcD-associated flavoprotein CzcO
LSHHQVAIIGTGFAGLGMAIRLKQEGIDDFVLLERAEDVGGTWRDNSYPGCQCDIPSHLYSLSFAPNPDWSRTYSLQAEIWDYLRTVAGEHGVVPHIRFGHEVLEAEWREDEAHWLMRTASGELTADVLVNSSGGLADPKTPDIPGLDEFEGTWFHSAQWDHGHNLTAKRVAVVGTGASAIQIVPRIQPQVGHLDVYQRTPPWVMPHRDRPITRVERWLYRNVPKLQRVPRYFVYWLRELMVLGLVYSPKRLTLLEKVGRKHMESAISDPELLAKVTPDYTVGCKRILPSNAWYPALAEPNTELVTAGIARITPSGIVDEDGVEHPCDTIVFATGFYTTELPAAERLRGRSGRTLAETWDGTMQAYLGTVVAEFPNLFLIPGPNTGLGHNSVVVMLEGQIAFALAAIREMRARDAASVEVRPEVQEDYNRAVQEKLANTVWNTGGCSSWYLDKRGINTVLWPDFTWRFRLRTQRFEPGRFVFGARSADRPARRSPPGPAAAAPAPGATR